MLAKRHLKIPVHQMAASWKVQRLFAVMCAMCLKLTWKNLSIQYRTLTTTLWTYQFGLGKNKVPNESANCWYCILVAIKQIFAWFYHFCKKMFRQGITLHVVTFAACHEAKVCGWDMKIDRFRLSKARQDGKMRLRLHKILDSFYIHGTIDQPTSLRLKAGRSCLGDQCPHLCGNHVHQQIHHS